MEVSDVFIKYREIFDILGIFSKDDFYSFYQKEINHHIMSILSKDVLKNTIRKKHQEKAPQRRLNRKDLLKSKDRQED